MIIVLRKDTPRKTEQVAERTLLSHGVSSRRHVDPTSGSVALLASGPGLPLLASACDELRRLPGVEAVLLAPDETPLVSSALSQVLVPGPLGPVSIGSFGTGLVLIAGPCAIESEDQLRVTGAAVRAAVPAGRALLRGGAFKPRTSPYSFAGLGVAGLHLLRKVGDELGLPVVSEALDEASLEAVAEHCQMVQIGARTMAAFGLLRAAARLGRPILLKRGFGATVEEWLSAAEHLLSAGAPGVVLCERGIRTFEKTTRATLDLGGLAAAQRRTRLPILVDPSHAAGTRGLVRPLALGGIAAGANGLLVECHPLPETARSDAAQALTLAGMAELARVAWAVAEATQVAQCPDPPNLQSATHGTSPTGPMTPAGPATPATLGSALRSNGSACG